MIEGASTRQAFSEIAYDVVLSESSPNVLYDVHNYRAWRRSILMRNKHDILNQHKKLHQIADIFTKYFSVKIRAVLIPQPFFPKFNPVVHHGSTSGEKIFS
jgi:hypothetical protein